MADTVPHTRLPDRIIVRRQRGIDAFSIEIDGELLPFAVAADEGAVTTTAHAQMPSVTITLLARSVLVEDLLGAPPEEPAGR